MLWLKLSRFLVKTEGKPTVGRVHVTEADKRNRTIIFGFDQRFALEKVDLFEGLVFCSRFQLFGLDFLRADVQQTRQAKGRQKRVVSGFDFDTFLKHLPWKI